MDSTEIAFLSATELGTAIRLKQISPVEAVEAYLERIQRIDPKVNSYITVCADQALADARQAEAEIQRGVLGNNGDIRFDTYYQKLQQGIFSNVPQLGYKSLTGDNNSISAIGCALGVSILQHQLIPKKFNLNSKSTLKLTLISN